MEMFAGHHSSMLEKLKMLPRVYLRGKLTVMVKNNTVK
jgi:hypothetical protein